MTKSATKKLQLAARRRAAESVHRSRMDPHDDDPMPADIDELGKALAQRMYRYIGTHTGAWRHCRLPLCRRAHACHGDRCRPERPPMTPEQEAWVKAHFYRTMKRIAEERGLDEDDGAVDGGATAARPRQSNRARR